MSSALLAALFAILGTSLAVTSAACFALWRRVRALTSAAATRAASDGPPAKFVAPPAPAPALAKAGCAVTLRVDELAGRHRALEARLASVEASATDAAIAIAIASQPGGPRIGRRVDRGVLEASGGPTLISVPDLSAPPSPASGAAAALDRRFGPVWAMADEGIAVDAIARRTGYPIGQVELILGLRRQLLVAEAGPDA